MQISMNIVNGPKSSN